MATQAKPYVTPEQYMALEREADVKSEYISGEMYSTAGASYEHNLITANLIRELGNQLRSGPCRSVANGLRVRVDATGMYTYPDVVVVCGEPQFTDDHLDTLLNPTVIIEVLSPSTEAYDRGEKFAHYRRLGSLAEYVLVTQTRQRIERFRRQADEQWLFSETSETNGVVRLASVDCSLALSEVYAGVPQPQQPDAGHANDHR
jgi:Uma2 family endonuclease